MFIVSASGFKVIYLGNKPVVDTGEDNTTISSENGELLLGTYGSPSDPLSNQVHMFDPGSTSYSRGGLETSHEPDNDVANEKFTVDGGPEQTFDGAFA